MKHLGLLDTLLEKAVVLDYLDLRRYEDGSVLLRRPAGPKIIEYYGSPWM